jgi:hypothetical protein
MSYLNIVISLKDFIIYSEEILKSNNAYIYIEERDVNNLISKVLFSKNNFDKILENYNSKNLNFFISTEKLESINKSFYDDDICQYVIEGVGGRIDKESIERIALRIISKTPDKTIKKLFDAIKNKLKKDENFGMGVKGNSAIHKNYFYQKDLVGSKLFITDMYNEKAPIIEII